MHDVVAMLLGAALVAVGVIASAVADRIRGLRVARDRRATDRGVHAPPPAARAAAAPRTIADERLRADVSKALTTAGYPRPDALAAVDACAGSERSSLEAWTRAALRKLAVNLTSTATA